MGVEIRPLQTLEDLHACEALQQRIWGFNDRSVVPHHLLRTSIDNGGLLLGALDGDDAVGFVFSFPGYDDVADRWKHCSLMCGVLPERQYEGLGFRLKQAQCDAVRAQGLELITWTFDPLQSLNAYFNLGKLGAIARRYERNIYGDIRDHINQGLKTDRFTAEWWLGSPRVTTSLERPSAPTMDPPAEGQCVNRVEWTDPGYPANAEIVLDLDDDPLWVEIPSAVNAIKRDDLALAQRWRSETREMFEYAFQRGFIAESCVTTALHGRPRSWYRLTRTSPEALLDRPRS
ncbi:MAG: hypothetical protein ABEK03_00885 [Candidatus Bipolaricaulia bacterium]